MNTPDPLVRAYHRVIQHRIMQRMKYDMMRYDAIDTYTESQRRALHRAAKLSARQLDDMKLVAAMRARLVLDGVYEDISRDLAMLQKDIREVSDANRKALDALELEEDEENQGPDFYKSFDIFK